MGPPRVWLRNDDAPGLCMTRAFGDQLAATVGVICEPEFQTVSLKSNDKCAGLRASLCVRRRTPATCANQADTLIGT